MKSLGMVLVIGALCASGVAQAGPCDPLIVDLSGDGVFLSSSAAGQGVAFNLRGDAVVRVGWPTTTDDAWLAIDLNGNGVIDSGLELFSDFYAKGGGASAFGALAQYDADGNGTVDELDPEFSKLRLWRDANRDGISQPGELSTLASVGIQGIALYGWGTPSHDAAGNAYLLQAKVVSVDGTKRYVQAVEPAIGTIPGGHTSAVSCDGGNGGQGGTTPPSSPPPTQWHCTAPCYGTATLTGWYAYPLLEGYVVGQGAGICGPTGGNSQPPLEGFFTGAGVSSNQSSAINLAQTSCAANQSIYHITFWDGQMNETNYPYITHEGNSEPWCSLSRFGDTYCLSY